MDDVGASFSVFADLVHEFEVVRVDSYVAMFWNFFLVFFVHWFSYPFRVYNPACRRFAVGSFIKGKRIGFSPMKCKRCQSTQLTWVDGSDGKVFILCMKCGKENLKSSENELL